MHTPEKQNPAGGRGFTETQTNGRGLQSDHNADASLARTIEHRRRIHCLSHLLLGAGSGELLSDVADGARRIMSKVENFRLEDPGASAAAESLAAHLDALSHQAMKLSKRIRLERAEAAHDD